MGIAEEPGARKRDSIRDFACSRVDPAHEKQVKIPSLLRPKTGAPVTSESFKARATAEGAATRKFKGWPTRRDWAFMQRYSGAEF